MIEAPKGKRFERSAGGKTSSTQYRMRRILITHPSTDAWTSWLIELGWSATLAALAGGSRCRGRQICYFFCSNGFFGSSVPQKNIPGRFKYHIGILPTSPEYRTWFIAVVWPIERLRRTALLSALEGWVQADADDGVGTGEVIVLAPRTSEVGESLAARDDSEDVATWRRQDT
ncbi:hypothetical protein JCGZ_03248 [Jatropha curcas]|uniref:Uncharacterized protein n=1 Tax=Jatropha curcas TaxID=180498 RepID=A0A067L1M0_JATCU|nr:hypothetical protein JCGZ_03248 [Jatropha curcas]